MGAVAIIKVDTSRAMAVINKTKKDLSKGNADWCVEHTIRDTGNRCVRQEVKKTVLAEYAVGAGWVNSQIKRPIISGARCVVPIRGPKGTIGGTFAAGGGGYAAGKYNGKAKKRIKRGGAKITAKILKGSVSVLPPTLPNQGGNPPFRMSSGAVMTRKTSQSHPIVRVSGRAVAEMTDKHFESKIQEPINDYMIKRMGQLVKEKMGV